MWEEEVTKVEKRMRTNILLYAILKDPLLRRNWDGCMWRRTSVTIYLAP